MDPYERKKRSNQMQPTTASRVIYIANKNPEMMPPSEMSNSGSHMKKIRPTGQIVRSMDPDRTRNMNDHSIEPSNRNGENEPEDSVNANWWWNRGKPKKPKRGGDGRNGSDDSKEDYLEKRRRIMIKDFYERKKKKIRDSNSAGDGGWKSGFKVMKSRRRPDDTDESEYLMEKIMDGDRENMPSTMGMPVMRGRFSRDIDEDDEFKVPVKTGDGIVSKMRKFLKRTFNGSIESPMSRFLVAVVLGLITTLAVYALISLVKILIFRGNDQESASRMREYGQGSYQYTPIPPQAP